MRHQWIVRRTMQPTQDGQRRWDRAYQELLAWSGAGSNAGARDDVVREPSDLEVKNESGSLCPCLSHPACVKTPFSARPAVPC